jgi:hypothetical protein
LSWQGVEHRASAHIVLATFHSSPQQVSSSPQAALPTNEIFG